MAASPPRFQPHPIPPIELLGRGSILFRHPGYPIPNILLHLPRVDRVAENGVFGVHHRTALLACQIIAGNAFDTGRLTLDKEGQVPVTTPPDGILMEEQYYLIVGDGPDKYPIVPSFQDWEFPHNRLPDSWLRPTDSPSITSRCGITNFSFAIEEAHLIPKEEGLWYIRNEMKRYAGDVLGISNPRNLLSLKSDIYKSFDARWFIICPKVPNAGSSPQFVTHLISDTAAELWPTYHNTLVQYLPPGSRYFLFARFAWAILLQVKDFITSGHQRYVTRLSTNHNNEDEIAYKPEHLPGSQLKNFYGGGGSKAATPLLKRKSGAGSMNDHDFESSGEESNANWDMKAVKDDWDWDGRERRYETSSDTIPDADIRPSLPADLERELKEALPKGMSEGEVEMD